MAFEGEGVHRVRISALEGVSLLAPGGVEALEQALRSLPRRYPGLKVVRSEVRTDGMDLTLDLGRLDEDLQRVVQSFKNEAKKLAKPRKEGALWRWGFEEL